MIEIPNDIPGEIPLRQENPGEYPPGWLEQKKKAVCILLHDFNALPFRYSGLGEYLCANDILCITPEILTPVKINRKEVVTLAECRKGLQQVQQLLKDLRQKYSDLPLFLCGEGYGAVLAMRIAQVFPAHVSGIITIAPFLHLPLNRIVKMDIFLNFLFRRQKNYLLPFKISMITKDQWYKEALLKSGERDYWYSARFLWEYMIMTKTVLARKNRLSTPILLLLAADDLLIENAAVHSFYQDLRLEDKNICYYKEFHALSVPVDRDSVYADISGWISERSPVI